ncbi:MAG: hypothetical protein G01um101425_129 [Candidatus Peregrinibacteria bacterium Gr01-1014_25]|nr:MAG: hypothetical protein G01um101425_129 [Candidatus Peregrinibacteria bacterium Gr01-1014_25]
MPRKPKITGAMRVQEIITILPEAEPVLARYGLHCFACDYSDIETLEDGCASHGFPAEDIAMLVGELNELLRARPARSQTLNVTQPAAEHLRAIAEAEQRLSQALEVVADGHGGFCMEFRADIPAEALVFSHSAVDLTIIALPLTLARIGGATIDFREGRFKLDLPEERGCCGKKSEECGCANGKHSLGDEGRRAKPC